MSKLSCRIWTLTIGICSYLKISVQDVPSCQNTQHKEIYIRVSLVAFLFSFRFPLCIAILAVAGMQTADTLFYFLIFIFSSAYCWGLKSVRGDVLRCLMVLGFKCSVTGTASSWHSRAGRGCVVVAATVATMTSSPGIKLPCNLCFGVCSFLRRALQQVWCELQEGTEQYLWKSDVLFVGWFATNERKNWVSWHSCSSVIECREAQQIFGLFSFPFLYHEDCRSKLFISMVLRTATFISYYSDLPFPRLFVFK